MPSVSLSLDQAADKIATTGWANAWTTPVTYAFRSTGGGGFERFTNAQIAAAEQALALWSDVANIKFQRAGAGTYSNTATMLFAGDTSDPQGYAWAYFPGARGTASIDGNVYVNPDGGAFASLPVGSYEYMALMHEIGHAIGLDHPGSYNGGAPTYAADAEYKQDSMQYTVMSYFDAEETGALHRGLYAATPLLHDIAAAQLLYGANYTTRAGNTVYGFHSNANRSQFHIDSATEKAVFAIWDGGGTDTLDFSGYRQNAILDLNQGAFSSVGGLAKNVAIAANCVIEHAIGGAGNDRLVGNALINRLEGNGGNDTLRGGGGSDSLLGGAGADSFLIDIVPTATNADRITDFNPLVDTIRIENFVFNAVGAAGQLAAGAFYAGASAHDANDRIIYQRATGFLFYDEDGIGGAAAVKIAAFTSSVKPALTAADIIVY